MRYVRSPRLEYSVGRREPPYRSRGETQVGRLFDRYGIPFCYERPTIVYDRGRYRTWHPDFTLPTYDNLIVEYAGMMDVPAYVRGIRHKERVYRANELTALFIYPTDIQGPDWPSRLIGVMQDAAGHTPATEHPATEYEGGCPTHMGQVYAPRTRGRA